MDCDTVCHDQVEGRMRCCRWCHLLYEHPPRGSFDANGTVWLWDFLKWVSWWHALSAMASLVRTVSLAAQISVILIDQRADCWWTVSTELMLIFALFVISQPVWPTDSEVLFGIHVLFNWWITCHLSFEGHLTNGLAVCETLAYCQSEPSAFLSVLYHNVSLEQILPYKEVHFTIYVSTRTQLWDSLIVFYSQ